MRERIEGLLQDRQSVPDALAAILRDLSIDPEQQLTDAIRMAMDSPNANGKRPSQDSVAMRIHSKSNIFHKKEKRLRRRLGVCEASCRIILPTSKPKVEFDTRTHPDTTEHTQLPQDHWSDLNEFTTW